MNSKLENTLNQMDKFDEVIFNHIYREGNTEADKLANEGADGKEIFLIKSDNKI